MKVAIKLDLPNESQIIVKEKKNGLQIIFPVSKRSILTLIPLIFMAIFSFAWTCGGLLAISSFFLEVSYFHILMLVWLCGWLFGVISLNSTVYKGFRRTKPELLEFHDSHFYHCEGIEPLDFFCVKSTNQLSNLSELLKFSQTEVDISIRDVSNFQLSQLPHGSKLSYDIGIKRFEVGKTIGDVEKQIIYKFLLKYYSL